jgi:hypothetical protein
MDAISSQSTDVKLDILALDHATLLYDRALKDTSFRSNFIELINLGEYAQYISKVVPKYFGSEGLMCCCPSFVALHWGIAGTKSKILVYKNAFDSKIHKNFADFYSTLVFHEGFHAKENYNGDALNGPHSFDVYSRKLFDTKKELRAYTNQISNISNANSEDYVSIIKERIEMCNKIISKFS